MECSCEDARTHLACRSRAIPAAATTIEMRKLTAVFGAVGVLLCIALYPNSAGAQPASAAKSGDIMIKAAVPGAMPVAQPGPNTPVPAWAQQSYDAYLQMKAKAHGGTHYTRRTYWQMPDWSGVWNHIDGFAWDHTVNPIGKRDSPKDLQAYLDHCQSFPCKGWMTAALTPKFALRYREKLIAGAHDVAWDYLSDCLPAGFPRDMLISAFLRWFVVTPTETLMYFQEDEGNRTISPMGGATYRPANHTRSGSVTRSAFGTETPSSRTRSICAISSSIAICRPTVRKRT